MKIQNYLEGGEGPPRQLKQVLPFILMITIFFAILHWIAYLITTKNFPAEYSNGLIFYKIILLTGLLSMPAAFFANHKNSFIATLVSWLGYIWMGLFNLLFFFSTLQFILELVLPHTYSYWPLIATVLVGAWSLRQGIQDPNLNYYQIKNTPLEKFKVVQISDLHIGMLHLNKSWLRRIVEKINTVDADMIALTGDLVEGDFSRISPQLQPLSELHPHIPKFYITGNHEYIHGSGPWEKRLQELGFIVLHNEHQILEHNRKKILIAGVPDRMIGRFIRNKKSLPDAALATPATVDYKILLAHEPSSVFDIHSQNCDIVLSGHTHGGQIFPFHILVRLVQPVVKGFKRVKGVLIFAHQGTGFWGPPLRWFSRSEIAVLVWS